MNGHLVTGLGSIAVHRALEPMQLINLRTTRGGVPLELMQSADQ